MNQDKENVAANMTNCASLHVSYVGSKMYRSSSRFFVVSPSTQPGARQQLWNTFHSTAVFTYEHSPGTVAGSTALPNRSINHLNQEKS